CCSRHGGRPTHAGCPTRSASCARGPLPIQSPLLRESAIPNERSLRWRLRRARSRHGGAASMLPGVRCTGCGAAKSTCRWAVARARWDASAPCHSPRQKTASGSHLWVTPGCWRWSSPTRRWRIPCWRMARARTRRRPGTPTRRRCSPAASSSAWPSTATTSTGRRCRASVPERFVFGRLLSALLLVPSVIAAQQADIKVIGGMVHDGNGGAPIRADVVVRGDRIVFVGDASSWSANLVIDATGKVIAPGYIDPHVHAGGDLSSADRARRQAAFALMQGVTTVIIGNDGQGTADVAGTMAEFERDSIGVNVGMLVGHGYLRARVVGPDDREPTRAELDSMRVLVEKAMREGALGLSSGLY